MACARAALPASVIAQLQAESVGLLSTVAQPQSWAIWGLACTLGGPGCPTSAHAALRSEEGRRPECHLSSKWIKEHMSIKGSSPAQTSETLTLHPAGQVHCCRCQSLTDADLLMSLLQQPRPGVRILLPNCSVRYGAKRSCSMGFCASKGGHTDLGRVRCKL